MILLNYAVGKKVVISKIAHNGMQLAGRHRPLTIPHRYQFDGQTD